MMSCQRDYVTPRGERFLAVRLFLPNIQSALFYTHLRLLSAPLFAATIEALQPERTASPWA